MSLIKLTRIDKEYRLGDRVVPVLKGINLSVNTGEWVAIMGASGSGKSTLMNVIGLLDRPTRGAYHLNHQDMLALNDHALAQYRNQSVGFIFQSFFLLSRLTALENVCLPMRYDQRHHALQKKRAIEQLKRVGMGLHLDHRPAQLSGGQQQRVAIARALICEPDVILADEPTGALDSRTTDDIMALFSELNGQEGRTLIIVTHEREVGARCHRQIEIIDGAIPEGFQDAMQRSSLELRSVQNSP